MVLLSAHLKSVFHQVFVKREESPSLFKRGHHIKTELVPQCIFSLSSFPFLGQMIQVFLSAFNLLPSD